MVNDADDGDNDADDGDVDGDGDGDDGDGDGDADDGDGDGWNRLSPRFVSRLELLLQPSMSQVRIQPFIVEFW